MTNAATSPVTDLASLNEDQLRERIAASPYVAVYRVLLARKCRGSKDDVYRKALHEAALYTPDRVRLYEWLHRPDAEEPAIEETGVSAQEPVPAAPDVVDRLPEPESRSEESFSAPAAKETLPARTARKRRAEASPHQPVRRKKAEAPGTEVVGVPQADTTEEPAPGLKELLLQTAAARQVSLDEKHSFLEWLDILESGGSAAAFRPVDETQPPLEEHAAAVQFEAEWQREIDALDEPGPPGPEAPGPEDVESLADRSIAPVAALATETLAKIMLKQGKIKQALAVYEELLLKYPEKSDYFAALIDDLKAK